MKFHNIIPFLIWLIKRWFGWVGRVYRLYDEFVSNDPIAIIPTILLGMLLFAIIGLLAVAFKGLAIFFSWIAIILECLWFGNYFRIIIREKYKAFCEERQKLLNDIKNS